MDIISFLLAVIGSAICYELALAYIGKKLPARELILPIVLFSLYAYVAKVIFQIPPLVHTFSLVVFCFILLWLVNKISPILSILGSILSFMTVIFGGFLLAYPLLMKLGIDISGTPSGMDWIPLNTAEYFLPLIVLFILKVSRVSITKYFSM